MVPESIEEKLHLTELNRQGKLFKVSAIRVNFIELEQRDSSPSSEQRVEGRLAKGGRTFSTEVVSRNSAEGL